ncbi:MAG: hypothetical protein QNJ77_15495 [Acidimicrobiia bacterium]|nr:hypothetical protein [Acidimicrobiia bacterium]
MPIGPGGIEYSGSGDEQEITGPSLLAADPNGGLHFYDPVGRRILTLDGREWTEIDMAALDIASVTALAANSQHLIAIEIFFQPVRNRIHRIGFEGDIVETIEIPEGFRLEDGLSGVRSDIAGRIIVEFAGGEFYAVWNGPDLGFEMVNQLDVDGYTITPQVPDLLIGDVLLAAELTAGLGGLRYLTTTSDGFHIVERQDVLSLDPEFLVVSTVEWYASDGALLGAARIPPLQDQYISTPPPVAILPDGRAVALVALEDEVRLDVLPRQSERITK